MAAARAVLVVPAAADSAVSADAACVGLLQDGHVPADVLAVVSSHSQAPTSFMSGSPSSVAW
eukprot:CAMPEP_0178560874 /NCGR_PEP_ID=MMETSP0697-20121206/11715_2 /TAXON_ID=265572 /ORGANISM="Extubocellulus spinifer, Strain CCMP396" /LENGTH=61 /DNA_ID=CAMNT_0020194151 /DNA_START=660 /DNA_END=842 /DNA_ORIENTATION=-